jgi:3,5-epimerase/4-reductase
MIGGAFVRQLEATGHSWVQLRSRLHQQSSIRNELELIRPTVSVLIAAGVGTRPNTRWCEDHRVETIDANVTGQLAIAKICADLGLHLTLIGTCGFYHYDAEHALGSGVGFPEDAVPNHECNFYYAMRALLERLLNESGAIGGVLNLRALFPFDHKVTSASLVGKLLRFAKINCIPTSMTVLPDLVPLAVELMIAKEVGHVNWVCEGVASNGDVLRAYKEIVDESIAINEVEVSQETSRSTGNSAAYVVPAKLIARFGADRVPKVGDAIGRLMKLIKDERSK